MQYILLVGSLHDNCSEALVKSVATEMISNGMRDAGYTHINLDDCCAFEPCSSVSDALETVCCVLLGTVSTGSTPWVVVVWHAWDQTSLGWCARSMQGLVVRSVL